MTPTEILKEVSKEKKREIKSLKCYTKALLKNGLNFNLMITVMSEIKSVSFGP